MRRRLITWHRQRKEAEKGNREEPEDWEPPNDLSTAWATWVLLESTGWRHLPMDGGMLDQPDGLMDDVATIAWLSGIIKEQMES